MNQNVSIDPTAMKTSENAMKDEVHVKLFPTLFPENVVGNDDNDEDDEEEEEDFIGLGLFYMVVFFFF